VSLLSKVNKPELERLIASRRPVFIFFTARWCRPCQWTEGEINDLADRYGGGITFAKVELTEHPDLIEYYNLHHLPTMLLVNAHHPSSRATRAGETEGLIIGYQTADDLVERFDLARYPARPSQRPKMPLDLTGYPEESSVEIPDMSTTLTKELLNRHDETLESVSPGLRWIGTHDFHAVMGNVIGAEPGLRDQQLRKNLIEEERHEVIDAINHENLAHLAGELSDLLYVVYGSAVTFGLKLPDLSLQHKILPPAIRFPEVQKSRISRAVAGLIIAIDSGDLPRVEKNLMTTVMAVARVEADCGLDLAPFFAEVQRANMAKASGPVRADGKRLKPPDWQAPDLTGVLAAQMTEGPAVEGIELT
jgi:predicted HAD superfamily Cof-like phosphohydrolase/thiol-disulfide isomerase/thioredoxin